MSPRRDETTKYSPDITGDDGNYRLAVRFDRTGGYVGITQRDPTLGRTLDRVLLSPAQVKALVAFVAPRRMRWTR